MRAVILAVLVGCNGGGTSGAGGVIHLGSPGGSVYRYDVRAGRATLLFEGSVPEALEGGEVLFVDDSDPFAGATIAVADGPSRTVLFTPDFAVASWRPTAAFDAERLAMTYYVRGFTHAMSPIDGTLVVDRGGAVLTELPGVFDPAWTPDGRLLLSGSVETNESAYETPVAAGLYLAEADGSGIARVDPDLHEPKQPAVSPSGDEVAFIVDDDVWVMGIDGSDPRQVTSGSKLESHPAWSPDGRAIACASYGVFEDSDFQALAIVPADGDGPVDLANDADVWPTEPDFATSSSRGRLTLYNRPTWR